jgi:hypothetical protein
MQGSFPTDTGYRDLYIFLFSSATPGERRERTLEYVIIDSSSILPYQSLLQYLIPCCITPTPDNG